jgi:diguanylate cyclase (GGDEF)-like protein/PAS domain S-box-containing protein
VAPRLKSHPTKRSEGSRTKDSLITLAAYRRDAILEAIAESAHELLRSTDLDASLAKVLERVGKAAGADRLHILLRDDDRHAAYDRIGRHYIWSAPGISAPRDFIATGKTLTELGLASWARILAAGDTVVGRPRDFDPAVSRFMANAGIRSALGVPIFCDGEWCGIIGFDDCRSEHDWLPAEIDIVKILAELVGAAVASLRRLRGLTDANRIIENSPTVVYRLGPQRPFPLDFLSHNIARYGYSADQLLAQPDSWPRLIHDEDLPAALVNLAKLVDEGSDYARMKFRVKRPDGSFIWFDGETRPLRDHGRLIAIEGIFTDITEQKRAEENLAASHMILATAIESSPDAILVVDQNDRISTFNQHFVELWDIPPRLIAPRDHAPILKLAASRVADEDGFLARVNELYAHQDARSHDELELKDGRIVDRHSAPLRGSEGQFLGRIWFFRDITDRRRAEEKIVALARSDALTGLPNRVAFIDRLQLALARAARGEHRFAIHYMDLDRFKDINDTLGHGAGDTLLKNVAERLRRCVRETDVVARFGGDEFAVLQEDVTNLAGTEALAANICRALAAPFSIEGNQLHTGASIGIVPFRAGIGDPEAMMSKADLALYRAKSEGRNTFRFHIHELDEDVRERLTISEDLHNAVENAELALHYQPQVELASGRLVGLEALIRWNHPRRGVLLPEQFIPVAESSGSIVQVGQWAIENVCRQIVTWREEAIAPPIVAVNISAGQFKLASNFDHAVAAILARYGVAPAALELELTESVLMEATQRHRAQFEGLRGLGVRLAIDDFGVGYSSFDYLHSFRVERLKIDRRFIDAVTTHTVDATIVRAIIRLADELGIDVIAEGVETAAQRAFLIESGCRFAQGYLFGEPIPAMAATRLLQGTARP